MVSGFIFQKFITMSFRRRGAAGALMPFGLDYADVDQHASGEQLYYPVPVNGTPTALENECAKQFTHFAEMMKDGALYTGTLASLKQKGKHAIYLEGGVNDGIKRYSDRFRKKIKVGRSVDDHPFILDFFPKELHSVMVAHGKKQQSLQVIAFSEAEIDEGIQKSQEDKKKEIKEKLDNVNDEEPEENAEEDEDEEFEDDYDDDYNAERYFDDGDDLGDEDDGDTEAAF